MKPPGQPGRKAPLAQGKGLAAGKGLSQGKGLAPGAGPQRRTEMSQGTKGLASGRGPQRKAPMPAARVDRPNVPAGADAPKVRRQRTRKTDGPFRAEVMSTWGKACRACARTTWVQAAHLIAKSQGGPSVVENGISLCQACHTGYDGYTLQLRYEWLDPKHVAFLAARRYVAWDEEGRPFGAGWRRFAPLTSGQIARRREDAR